MSKQRALELCDEADQELRCYNIELLEVVKSLAKAVRELAKDEPIQVPYEEITLNHLPPPKSDPPSPT